jgi:hypothetical protein
VKQGVSTHLPGVGEEEAQSLSAIRELLKDVNRTLAKGATFFNSAPIWFGVAGL